ncbi:hypothetical protein BSPWISOXPB_9608 [uncultured Gammaproteobacteria bacterium]|nr:hypothetical protein BSPWISOXPB_9608 [uncultured Gammaproteobacteria bacterium]
MPSAISTAKSSWSQTAFGWAWDGEGDVTHITAHFNGEGGLGDELTGIWCRRCPCLKVDVYVYRIGLLIRLRFLPMLKAST